MNVRYEKISSPTFLEFLESNNLELEMLDIEDGPFVARIPGYSFQGRECAVMRGTLGEAINRLMMLVTGETIFSEDGRYINVPFIHELGQGENADFIHEKVRESIPAEEVVKDFLQFLKKKLSE